MRRASLIAVGAAALAAAVSVANPAFAQYGAVAYDDGTDRRGVAWDYDSEPHAEQAAMRDCKSAGCKVVVRFGPKLCAAIATPEEGKGIGAAARPAIEAARSAALEDCRKHNTAQCVIRDARCNR